MDWGKAKFFLGEVRRNFSRNAGMQFTAIGTVAVTIVLLGAFLFVRAALTGVGDELLSQIAVSAYLNDDVSAARAAELRAQIVRDPRVASVAFVSKAEGLREMRSEVKGEIDTSLLATNPLPDKLRVKVKDPAQVEAVAASIGKLNGVHNVVYGADEVRRLLQAGAVLRRIGIGIIIAFVLVAGIIISNTIRLTVFARRREIAIMQLVGATNTYIHMPFICEGLLDGVLGAIVAVLVLAAARALAWPHLLAALPFVPLQSTVVSPIPLVAELLVVGAAVGVIASWISVRRYLRT